MIKLYRILLLCCLITLIFIGCATHGAKDRQYVSGSIQKRTGAEIGPKLMDSFQLPANVALDDGISEDEAVAIALWNNAQFQTDLTQLGFARADLIDAGALKNPVFSFLFPLGPKQMEWALNLPAEFLWQQPSRVALAKLNVEAVAENLVQHGLGLTRDVSIAYADLVEADQIAAILKEQVGLQNDIVKMTNARLNAGDISELEATAIRLEAARIKQQLIGSEKQAKIKRLALKELLGIILQDTDFTLMPIKKINLDKLALETLLSIAFAARPDLRAAELVIEAAGKQMGWERSKILNLTAVLDANAEGKEGFEMGPGLQFGVPLFDQNQGGRTRASTELERASMQYMAIKQHIARQVEEAYISYLAAKSVFILLQQETVTSALQAHNNAEKAYQIGDISYLEFIYFKRQLADAKQQGVQAETDLSRVYAQLLFSVGFDPSFSQ